MRKVTIAEYALLCGISNQAVRWRIEKKHIKVIKGKPLKSKVGASSESFIDIDKYPPMPAQPKGAFKGK